MGNWIRVEDRLPMDQDYQSTYATMTVLVTDGKTVCEGYFAIGGNHVGRPWVSFSDCLITKSSITHWQPLPGPPEDC